MAGIDFDSIIKSLNSFGGLAAAPVYDAQIGPDIGIVGAECQRFPVGVDGFLKIVGIKIQIAQMGPEIGVLRILGGLFFEFKNLGGCFDRKIPLSRRLRSRHR